MNGDRDRTRLRASRGARMTRRRWHEIPAVRNWLGLHSPSRAGVDCTCRRCTGYWWRPWRAARLRREYAEGLGESFKAGWRDGVAALHAAVQTVASIGHPLTPEAFGDHSDHDIHGQLILVRDGEVVDIDEDCDCPPDCPDCEAEGVLRGEH